MLKTLGALLLVLGMALAGFGCATGDAELEADKQVAQALSQNITKIDFDRDKLGHVLACLHEITNNLYFDVNWKALNNVKVDYDTPITMHLTNLPANEVLRQLVQQITTDKNNPVTYSIFEGAVFITTQRNLAWTREFMAQIQKDGAASVVNQRVAKSMKLPILKFCGNQDELGHAIDGLRIITNLSMYVNWKALNAVNVDQEDTRFSFDVSGMSVDRALRQILREANTDDTNPVAYGIINGIVVISTQKDLAKIREYMAHHPQDGADSWNNKIVAMELSQPITKLDFDHNRLGNVLDFIRITTELNLHSNWQALKTVKVDQETLVTLQLTRNTPASDALRLALQQVTTDKSNPVTYSIIDGIVFISTQKDLAKTKEYVAQIQKAGADSEANQRVAKALKLILPKACADRNWLANQIEFLQITTNLNFYVNWKALKGVNVDQETLISFETQGAPADVVLRLNLRQVTTDDNNPVTYDIINGIVVISTQKDLARTREAMAKIHQDDTKSEVNQRAAKALNQPIDKIELDLNHLANVFYFLLDRNEMKFSVNWQALNSVNVDQEISVSMQLKNVPASDALCLILQQVSTDDTNPVTYRIIDGVVTISTQKDLAKTK